MAACLPAFSQQGLKAILDKYEAKSLKSTVALLESNGVMRNRQILQSGKYHFQRGRQFVVVEVINQVEKKKYCWEVARDPWDDKDLLLLRDPITYDKLKSFTWLGEIGKELRFNDGEWTQIEGLFLEPKGEIMLILKEN